MSSNFAALGAQLKAINDSRPKGQGGKFAPKQKKLLQPKTMVKYANAGEYEWRGPNAKGTLIKFSSPRLRGVLMDGNFGWAKKKKEAGADGRDKFIKVCATTSHTEPGSDAVGNGRWKLPFFDHDRVMSLYNPKGMQLRDPKPAVLDEDGKEVKPAEEGKQVMSCAECRALGLNRKNDAEGIGNCSDEGSILFVLFEYWDAKNEEWEKLPEPMLVDIKSTRGSNDKYTWYIDRVTNQHRRDPSTIVTELSTKGPDGIGKFNMVFEEDLEAGDWAERAKAIYDAAMAQHNAEIAEYVAQKQAEREAAKGEGEKPAAQATPAKTATSKVVNMTAGKPAPKTTEPKAAPAPAPASGNDGDDEIPF